MSLQEIVVPETEPETEWVNGRALQKMSPFYNHSQLQLQMLVAMHAWAKSGAYGRVGPEWRFRVTPPGEITRPLVPDVAYLSFESFPIDTPNADLQVPLAAPTVAVEILSASDRRPDVDSKIETYLRAGTTLIVVIDYDFRIVELHDRDHSERRTLGQTIEHSALPGFSLDIRTLFESIA